MTTDRITQDQLITRVATLYATDSLDHELVDIGIMTERYDVIAKQVTAALGVQERREWSSYGCGFASFLESWFYRDEKRYEVSYPSMAGHRYRGVSVVFCLLEPMFVIGESVQHWDESGGGSVLPSLEMIDAFESVEIRTLGDSIRLLIQDMGVPQVSRRSLNAPISSTIKIESNMSNSELRLFDAFYHWMD